MKYAACGLMAAFLAAAVYGDIPDTAEGWYKPDKFSIEVTSGILQVQATDEYGNINTFAYEVIVNETGLVVGMDGVDLTDVVIDSVSYKALQAFVLAVRNKERIETIGKNLHNLTQKDGIHIRNKNTEQEFTIKFGSSLATAVSESSGEIPATSDAEDPADNTSLGWRDGKLQLNGWHLPDSSTSLWDYPFGAVAVRLSPNDNTGLHYFPWHGVDGLSLAPNKSTHKLELSGWTTAGANVMTPLAEAIKKTTKETFDDYELVVRNRGKGLNYVALGTLDVGGAPVDGVSITTNTADGATTQGVASLYGWEDAAGGSIPRKGAESLEWTSPADLVDGASLVWSADRKKYEVAGANVYAGNHARHYFGTSNDKSATLGWHELPNATTNRVEGDGITIASTAGDDPDVKVFGLRGWNRGWGGEPVFLANNGGALDYIPLSSLTNMAACACSNKWNGALAWLGGDAAIAQDGSLSLPDESLDGYLYGTLGYIYSTTADNLHFDNDGAQIQASFTAPENWVDGNSVELAGRGHYQIKGFAGASACAADLGSMLSNPIGSDAMTHLFLAKKTDTGELHYVPIGRGVSGGVKADGASIVTNAAGEAQLNGYPVAATGAMPYKTANGMGWAVSAAPAVPVLQSGVAPVMTRLGGSFAQNGGVLDLAGFSAAPNLAFPQKTGDTLTWQTNIVARVMVAATNNIVTSSVEWLDAAGSDGNGANAYSIRILRGRLAVNANGEIYVEQDDALTQYIRTTPHSAETGN